MLAGIWSGVAVVLIVASVGGLAEFLSYTDAQRARTPLRWRAYGLGMASLGLFGVLLLSWIATGRTLPWVIATAIGTGATVLIVLQRWMHRTMGVDRSPLLERLG